MNIDSIKTVLATVIGGNSLQDYLQTVILFLLFYFGFYLTHKMIVRRLVKTAKQTATDIDDLLVLLLSQLGQSFFLALALYFSTSFLKLPSTLHVLLRALLIIVFTIRVTILTQEILRYVIRHVYFRDRKRRNDPTIESAINSILGVLRWIVWAAALLFLLDNLGINITTMVAGIGITGIAVGLASQTILGDMFSAFAIFLDKPFEVGDFVIIDNFMGTVEHIGIKTTRVRSLFGEQLIFANSDLTKSRIKNYKLLEEPRGSANFMLAFNTPAAKLREAREVMLKTIQTIPEIRVDHVHLMNCGSSGYNYEAAFYVLREHVTKNFDIQQEVYFKIAESLESIGVTPTAQGQDIAITSFPNLDNPK
jgi:small-conductance mechanosensitive channel